MNSPNPYRGSSLKSFLEEEGILEEATTAAVKSVIAWQIQKEMEQQKLSKTAMARLMKTSRAQLDRVLNPNDGNVSLEVLQRAAKVLGRRVRLELA